MNAPGQRVAAPASDTSNKSSGALHDSLADSLSDPLAQRSASTSQAKQTRAASRGPLQAKDAALGPSAHELAQGGLSGASSPLPYADKIQASFGRHSISGVQAHVGGPAERATDGLNAQAYAQGDQVAFKGPPDLHTAAHEAAHVVQQRGGVQLKDNLGQRGDRYEQNADQVADQVVQGRSAEHLLSPFAGGNSSGGAVQAKADAPIQMLQYSSPSDQSDGCKTLMDNAGISNFGPFVWDDTNSKAPMFKVNPSYSSWTIDDCLNTAIYEPETKAVVGEKGSKVGLIGARRKAALLAIFGKAQGVVDDILAENNGKSPRALKSLDQEDSLSGGHTAERHILGKGKMGGDEQVALRAAFQKVGGTLMVLDSSGVATVFASESVANNAVAAAHSELTTNWATYRVALAKGTQVKLTVSFSSSVVQYTKADTPPGTAYADTELPTYMGGAGKRELYAGHFKGSSSDSNAPTVSSPLTAGGTGTLSNVFVIIDPKVGTTGGWAVYTAYPK